MLIVARIILQTEPLMDKAQLIFKAVMVPAWYVPFFWLTLPLVLLENVGSCRQITLFKS